MGDTSGEEKEGESGGTKSDRIWNPLFAVRDGTTVVASLA